MKKYKKIYRENENNIHSMIIDYFKNNPNPVDTDIHALAEKLNLSASALENHIYMVLTDYILNGIKVSDWDGVGKDLDERDVNPIQLRKGIEIEFEHTKNKEIAKKIAIDHLAEFTIYYTGLENMEKQLRKNETKSTTIRQA